MTRRSWATICRALARSVVGLDIALLGLLIDSRVAWLPLVAGFAFAVVGATLAIRGPLGDLALIVGPLVGAGAMMVMLNIVVLIAPTMPLGLVGALTMATLLTMALALSVEPPVRTSRECNLEGSNLGDLQWRSES